jgi:hypothetical protein
MKLILFTIIALTPAAALAAPYESQGGYSREQKCYKRVYRETYVPGTMNNPGYVKSYKERIKVPCDNVSVRRTYINGHEVRVDKHTRRSVPADDNSCIEGSILGGIAGGGAGAALSRKEGRLWAIPLGIVGGALVGCQVDGG